MWVSVNGSPADRAAGWETVALRPRRGSLPAVVREVRGVPASPQRDVCSVQRDGNKAA